MFDYLILESSGRDISMLKYTYTANLTKQLKKHKYFCKTIDKCFE